MDPEDASSLSVYYLERLLQEMMIGILVDQARSRVIPQSPAAFTVALSVISSQCSDPDLLPSLIAEQVGLSLRQLQRVFSGHDTTIEKEIRRERVEQAIAMLRSPDYAALTVTEIARYVGFSNGSGLARAMNSVGTPSPRQIRAQSAAEDAPAMPPPTTNSQDGRTA
jgi:AraC-like DNA-binding protein